MSQLRQHESTLSEHQVDVRIITFDADFMAKAYVRETELKWPLLIDAQRNLYHAYDMEQANLWTLYNPVSIYRYLKLIFQGRRPGRPGSDWSQLGGDIVIDPAGIVRMHHVSSDPHDRPSIEALLTLVGVI